MKILEEFWYGNIHPTERNIVSNSRVDKLLELVVKNEQQLIDLLSEQEQATFQELRNVQDELSGVNECESFTRGFREYVISRLARRYFLYSFERRASFNASTAYRPSPLHCAHWNSP